MTLKEAIEILRLSYKGQPVNDHDKATQILIDFCSIAGEGRKVGSGRLTLKDVPPPQEANMI